MRYFTLLFVFICFSCFLHADTNCKKHALFIDTWSNAVDIIVNSDKSQEEKLDTIKTILDKNIDVSKMSHFVLGRHGKIASEESIERFIKIYHKYIVNSYSRLIIKYFETNNIQGNRLVRKNQCVIYSKIKYKSVYIDVAYFTTIKNNNVQIDDISLEGKRTSIDNRNRFKKILQTSGINGLIRELESKL